jgi:ABC-type glycerol-3-phosphate transport system substrate-binding protein
MGGRVLKPDGSAEFNTPEGVRLVNWLKQTVDEKVMPLDIALSDPERDQQLCEAGRVGFDLEATHWLAAMRQKQGTPLSWMPSPGMDPGKPTPADVQGWNLVIPAAAKNPDAAWKLIEVWISPDIQMFQSTTAGYLPMRVSLQDNPAFQTPALDFIPRALAHASHDPLAFEWPENSDALNNALCRAVVSALSGKQDAPAALADAEQTYNTMVRK